jgi:hypothetical protein
VGDTHKPKMALVLKYKPFATVEIKDRMRKFGKFSFFGQKHEPPAHSQMRYQRPAIIKIKEDMLSATMNKIDTRIANRFCELPWRRVRREPLSQKTYAFNSPAADELIEKPCYKLDFG